MYKDQPLQHYLDDLAAGIPAPGGGSASALSGALAAALASMVCRLTLDKAGYESVQSEIASIITQTEEARRRFTELLEEDITAYGRLSAAYQLPRATGEEKAARSRAIQERLAGAAQVPLDIVECAARLSSALRRIVEIANTNILSDVASAVTLAGASARSAANMVRINLRYMHDATLSHELKNRLETALRTVEENAQQALDIAGTRSQ
jgi:methenyltetrahydrofolate cyclohydrolase